MNFFQNRMRPFIFFTTSITLFSKDLCQRDWKKWGRWTLINLAVSGGPLNVATHLERISFLVLQQFILEYHFAKPPDWKPLSVKWRACLYTLFSKKYCFPADAEYSYFLVDFTLKIALWVFLGYSEWHFCFRVYLVSILQTACGRKSLISST